MTRRAVNRLPFSRVPALLVPFPPPAAIWTPPTAMPSPTYYWAVTLGLGEVAGKRYSLREIGRRLTRFDRMSLLILLSKMGILFCKTSFAQRPALDMTFARTMCDAKVRKGAARFIASQRHKAARYFLFSEQQILRLALMALTYSKRGSRRISSKADLSDVAGLLLAINDHLDPLQGEKVKSLPVDTQRRLFVEMVLRNGIFNHYENFAAALARHWDLFVRLPGEMPDLAIDVGEAFRNATGVRPATYIALSFGLFSHWASLSLENAETFPMLANPHTFFSKSGVRGAAGKVLHKLSAPVSWFARQHARERSRIGSDNYAFRPLGERPVVRLSKTRMLCVSWRHLQKKLTENLYYEVLSGLRSETERGAFQESFGKLLEEYVRRLLRRVYAGTGRLFELKYARDEREAGDGIVLYPEALVILEVKSSRLLVTTAATGDLREFEQKLDVYLRGARQIDRVIRDFKAGLFDLNGVGPGVIRRYFPVLVTIQSIPQEPFVCDLIEGKRKAAGLLEDKGIQRLEIMHISELEEVEALLNHGHNLVELLEQKQSHLIYRDWSFRNYLHNQIGGEIPPNDYLKRTIDEMGIAVRRLHFG